MLFASPAHFKSLPFSNPLLTKNQYKFPIPKSDIVSTTYTSTNATLTITCGTIN